MSPCGDREEGNLWRWRRCYVIIEKSVCFNIVLMESQVQHLAPSFP